MLLSATDMTNPVYDKSNQFRFNLLKIIFNHYFLTDLEGLFWITNFVLIYLCSLIFP